MLSIGANVIIRNDLIIGERYKNESNMAKDCFVSEMVPFKGKVGDIAEIAPNGKYRLRFKGQLSCYNWTEEMFVVNDIDIFDFQVANHE